MFKKITQVRKATKKAYRDIKPHYPILSAKALLSKKHLAQILHRLPKIANAPEEHYNALYKQAILNAADFYQGLPAFRVPAFDYYGGMLDLNMVLAYESLMRFRKEFPVKNTNPEDMSPKHALWSYAIFTSALLYGVGYIGSNYLITVCDDRGRHVQPWSPFGKPMRALDDHYRCSLDPENKDSLAARVAPIIGRRLMPDAGFEWIASDKEVLEYWLAILQNDERGAGIFAKIVLRIFDELITNPEAIASMININLPIEIFEEHEKKQSEFFDKDEHDRDKSIEEGMDDPEEPKLFIPGSSKGVPLRDLDIIGINNIEIGEMFINWLRLAVKGHGLSINRSDSMIHMTKQGSLLVQPAILQEFIKSNSQLDAKSWQQIQQNLVKNGYIEASSFGKQAGGKQLGIASGEAKTGSSAIKIHASVVLNGTTAPPPSTEIKGSIPTTGPTYPAIAPTAEVSIAPTTSK